MCIYTVILIHEIDWLTDEYTRPRVSLSADRQVPCSDSELTFTTHNATNSVDPVYKIDNCQNNKYHNWPTFGTSIYLTVICNVVLFEDTLVIVCCGKYMETARTVVSVAARPSPINLWRLTQINSCVHEGIPPAMSDVISGGIPIIRESSEAFVTLAEVNRKFPISVSQQFIIWINLYYLDIPRCLFELYTTKFKNAWKCVLNILKWYFVICTKTNFMQNILRSIFNSLLWLDSLVTCDEPSALIGYKPQMFTKCVSLIEGEERGRSVLALWPVFIVSFRCDSYDRTVWNNSTISTEQLLIIVVLFNRRGSHDLNQEFAINQASVNIAKTAILFWRLCWQVIVWTFQSFRLPVEKLHNQL